MWAAHYDDEVTDSVLPRRSVGEEGCVSDACVRLHSPGCVCAGVSALAVSPARLSFSPTPLRACRAAAAAAALTHAAAEAVNAVGGCVETEGGDLCCVAPMALRFSASGTEVQCETDSGSTCT